MGITDQNLRRRIPSRKERLDKCPIRRLPLLERVKGGKSEPGVDLDLDPELTSHKRRLNFKGANNYPESDDDKLSINVKSSEDEFSEIDSGEERDSSSTGSESGSESSTDEDDKAYKRRKKG